MQKISVWRDNRIDQEEQYTLPELAKMFRESQYDLNEYRDAWPLRRCVGAWLSSWAVMGSDDDTSDFDTLVEYLGEYE